MIIKNGLVFGEKGIFEKKDLYLADGFVTDDKDKAASDGKVMDASGKYVVPGLVDVHTHGAVGHDFCDGERDGLIAIAEYERSRGITSFCPTSMTIDEDTLSKVFKTPSELINDPPKNKKIARIIGINMEGPFIASSKKGAQNEAFIKAPDVDMFRRLNKLSGNMIRLVTLAPETEGADAFVNQLKNEVHISLGHTACDYDTAINAFQSGADHVTHLFNAMQPLTHRAPGLVGAAFDSENVFVELICDGLHIAPTVIRSVIKMFGEDRVVAISDSMEAAGMPDGEYSLGGQKVYKTGNRAELKDHTLAGSATDLFGCFKCLLSIGIKLETALKLVTCNPARSIGEKKAGVLKNGSYADVLILNKYFDIEEIITG